MRIATSLASILCLALMVYSYALVIQTGMGSNHPKWVGNFSPVVMVVFLFVGLMLAVISTALNLRARAHWAWTAITIAALSVFCMAGFAFLFM